jgi:hypothetical protein
LVAAPGALSARCGHFHWGFAECRFEATLPLESLLIESRIIQ